MHAVPDLGFRLVEGPEALRPDLLAHLATWSSPDPDGLVFVGPKGGPLTNNRFGASVWKPALAVVGLTGVHFHDLRHAGNTYAPRPGPRWPT